MAAAAGGNWFIALVVPAGEPLLDAVRALPASLRRLPAGDLHITVAFLGPCGEARAVAAWQAIAARVHPPFAVRPASWRAMGPVRRPSALALTLADGQARAVALIEDWRGPALAAAGLAPEHRPALPHITLLRPRRRSSGAGSPDLRAVLAAAPVPDTPLLLQEIALYRRADPRRSDHWYAISRRRALERPELRAAAAEADAGAMADLERGQP